jgi:ribose-phosphate pyrophosphokinase
VSLVKIFATSGSEELSQGICRELRFRLPKEVQPAEGISLAKVRINRFSNDNIQVQVENIRGCFVVAIHTQTPPVNDRLIELFAILDAIVNANPADVLLVFPYMSYSRSDRKNQPRISTMGQLIPKIISNVLGIKRVLLLDPHDSHIKHYFHPTADEISALYLFADYIEKGILTSYPKEKCVVVFADAGAAKRYENLPQLINLPTAHINKIRLDNSERPVLKTVVGDVKEKTCILIDDEILTGGTVVVDANSLFEAGATMVSMFAIHAVLADKKLSTEEVIQRMEKSRIENFVITDSIPSRHKIAFSKKFCVLSVVPLLAEAISRTIKNESLTELHDYKNVAFYRVPQS